MGKKVSNNPKAKHKRDYTRIQRMWQKERGRTIYEVLTGIPDGPPFIPPGMKTFWVDLFGRESLNELRSPTAIRPTGPITDEGLERAISLLSPLLPPNRTAGDCQIFIPRAF